MAIPRGPSHVAVVLRSGRLRLFLQLALPFSLAIPACNCEDSLGQLRANVAVEPESLDFGRVAVGGLKEVELTIRNKGSLRIELTGFDADAPFVAPVGTSSVATGSVTRRRIGFRPTALGAVSGTLRIMTSVDDNAVLEVPLTGEGIQAAVVVDPPLVDFGDVLFVNGATPESRTITVSNPGTDSFELQRISLRTDANGAFDVDPMGAVKTFAPGESATLSVSFLASARGRVEGELVIETTAPEGEEIVVPLRANGVGPELQLCSNVTGQPEACVMGMTRPRLVFTTERTGMATGQIRAVNIGDRDLTINAVIVTGAATELSFAPAPSMTAIVVPPGQASTWDVTYTPQDYAFDSVIVSFASNSSSAGVESIRVEGTVIRPDLEVQPRGVTFRHTGNIPRGQTHVTIYNCGTAPVTLGQITLAQTGGPTAALSVANVPMAGTVIPPQPACSSGPEGAGFDVVFETLTNGNYTGTVSVPSDDPVDPVLPVNVAATKD